jgi:phosphatidate cytidylyltransferase
MLRTRLIVGTGLAALAVGMLLLDVRFAPWFPFLYATIALLAVLATLELLALLPATTRPNRIVAVVGVLALITLAWTNVILAQGRFKQSLDASQWVLNGFVALVILAFLFELAAYRAPGRSVQRLALTVWTFAYLGLLPAFLALLRTNSPRAAEQEIQHGTIALALTIFVPKACDIGAYFTGRFLGRTKMSPILSPKKTWEGAAGGLAVAALAALALNSINPVIPGGWLGSIAFGVTLGIAGILGDLAESLIKRDCERKDASEAIPGFGGVLDVVDSVLFAAPVAYWWLSGR